MSIVLNGTGGTISGVPGQVLQVLQTATSATIQTTSTAFVSASFGVTITPSSTSSKIYVTVQGGGAYMSTTAGNTLYATIYRNNTTNLGSSVYGLERISTPGGSWVLVPHSMSVLDSPASTSATTYTVYYRSVNGAAVDFSNDDRGVVTITAFEIAA